MRATILVMATATVACGGMDKSSGASQVEGGADTSDDSFGIPMCTPGIDASAFTIAGVSCFPPEALPTGFCNNEPECLFATVILCPPVVPSSTPFGPRTFYRCSCLEQGWACSMVSQDLGVCPPDSGAGPS
jgi:hypothetical protein